MFSMAFIARSHAGVESGRLPLQDRVVVGMAHDALNRIHTHYRRMAGLAVVSEISMSD